jgi:hypothetical protein
MEITKAQLVDVINELETDIFDVTVNAKPPSDSYLLKDVRMGAIPPGTPPMRITRHTEPEEFNFTVSAVVPHGSRKITV